VARSDQPRRRATRRAVARANERAVAMGSPRAADGGSIGGAKGFFPLPDGQRWGGRMGVCTRQTPGGSCRRQSWRAQQCKSGRCGDQAGGSLYAKDRRYNQPGWEMRWRSPDWRMRSPSEEGRANSTLLERGPLSSGGTGSARGPHTEAGSLAGGRVSRRLEQTHNGPRGCQGSDVSAERSSGRRQTELRGA
jgi:hypothetical protein